MTFWQWVGDCNSQCSEGIILHWLKDQTKKSEASTKKSHSEWMTLVVLINCMTLLYEGVFSA